MKNTIRSAAVTLLVSTATAVWGAMPSVSITVADSSGKTAFKGATNTSGIFVTPKLDPGNYAVQFTLKDAPKGSHYTLVLVAGTKKTAASAITAEKLAAGGVAMKIEVGPGRNIQGQVAAESAETRIGKNGKLMVWIPKRVGSNLPAHWAESDSAEAMEVMTSSSYSLKNMQSKQNQGVSPLNDSTVQRISAETVKGR